MLTLKGCRVLSAGAAFSLLVGCGTSNAAKKEEVDALTKEIRDQRERQAIMERRLADMDARLALLTDRVTSRPQAQAPAPGGSANGRPDLDVVRVGPTGRAAQNTPPQETEAEPRAEIREDINDGGMYLHVNRQVLAERHPDGRGKEPPDEQQLAAQEEAVVARTDPRTQYNLAMRQYKAHQYADAAHGFEEVADRWPEHSLADNAVYWTGVCYLQQGEMALAINELQKVPVRYPKSAKVPDALFQLSEAYQRVGDLESAKAMLTQLVEMYPAAEAAGAARENLARLNKQ